MDTFDELLRLVHQAADAREFTIQSGKKVDHQSFENALDELFEFYWRDCYPG